MKTDELDGALLDCWTGRAEGYTAEVVQLYGWRYCRVDIYGVGWRVYEPSGSAQLAADIMSRRSYTVYPLDEPDACGATRRIWLAEAQQNPAYHGLYRAMSPWIAICRLRVAEVFGDIVADE